MKWKIHIFFLVLLFFSQTGLPGPSALPSQTKTEAPQEPPQHEVTVTLKLVQVYVTDKKGNPVRDLEKSDFILSDNGEKKPLTEFERHILEIPSFEEKVQPEMIQPRIFSGPQELMNRKFFLFFDFAYSSPRGILKAREAALHLIDTKLHPTDEVGLLSYSALKGLTLHEYLTTDHEKIREVVEALRGREFHGRAENFEAEYWRQEMREEDIHLNPIDPGKRGGVFDKEIETSDDARRESRFQARHFFPKMIDLAKSLRYIPGYKHIILFSSGVPYSLIYGMQSFSFQKYGFVPKDGAENLGDPELQRKYEDMLKEFSNSNSTVYTLDTEDLMTKLNADPRVTGVSTLQNMAGATGGKYFGNVNGYEKHMEKIQNLTGSYYVLGYYIDEQWDGGYHKINVEVTRPGCKIYAQKGYFNPKPFSEYSKLEKMLHLVDLALSEEPIFQRPLGFPLTTLPYVVKGKPNLALYSKIITENIRELSGKEVEIVSIIFDHEDNIVKTKRERMDFSKLPAGNIYYSTSLTLDPGEYKCRIVIRNLETGRGAVASSEVVVPPCPDSGIRLYSPLLLKPEKNAFYMRRPSPVFPFDPGRYSPLVEELEQGTKSLTAVVRCFFGGIQQPFVQLSANLIHHLTSSGKAIPVTLSILDINQEEDTEVFLIEIETEEELQSGEYFLYLFAEESLTRLRSQVNTFFKVKQK